VGLDGVRDAGGGREDQAQERECLEQGGAAGEGNGRVLLYLAIYAVRCNRFTVESG
jgi:hypothetical protein